MKTSYLTKIVVTIAVALPLFWLCQAVGIHLSSIDKGVIVALVGSLAAVLCKPSRGGRAIDRVKDGQTEDFLANLERGRATVTQAAPR